MFLLLGVALVSAAGLAFEITLTRLFAIAQGYHFGFLAVSLALLGFGASGTALALRPGLAKANVTSRLSLFAIFFSLSLIASYLVVNYLPFDSYRIAWERVQLLYLLLYYLALVVPFLLSGLVLGLPLVAFPTQTTRVYAANLVGSGLGCVAALGALALFGGPGAVVFAALLAAFGALAFSAENRTQTSHAPSGSSGQALSNVEGVDERRKDFSIRESRESAPIFIRVHSRYSRIRNLVARSRWHVASLALAITLAALLIAPPPPFDLQISPYKGLSQLLRFPDARLVLRAWNAFSRVEVVESSAVRSAPGLSLGYRGALPPQRALFEDAESISPLTDAAPRELLDALPITLAYRLRPNARTLILKPGGGLEVLAALNAGAREIVAVEENPLVAEVAQQFAPHSFGDARVRLVSEGARSFVAHSRDRFDVVHLALSDPFRPVTAGAYALGENYLYTQEALRDYLDHLSDDGILVVSRWLQLPPTEEVRVGALAIAALERPPTDDHRRLTADDSMASAVSGHILALRSFNTLLLLVKRTPFTTHEIEIAKAFAEERQFDWVARPGLRAEEANRFNVLRDDEYFIVFEQLLDPNRRARLLASYAYDVTPPTDDHPFFFHFFKWEQMPQTLQLLGKLWQPFGGSGYLILLALLALSICVSGMLILMPLLRLGHRGNPGGLRELVYFACLGIGFLFVEIPLIQRFILFLDHPVYAFATVLFALLLASGAGSFLSARLPHRAMLALLVLAILVYFSLLPFAFELFLGYPFTARVLVSLIILAPMGFLMGIPFPKGLTRLNEKAPSLVPLAWGINGCASVISSILATIGAMSWGFSAVMLTGGGMYAVALAVLAGLKRET